MSLYDEPDFRAVQLVRRLSFYNCTSTARQLWCSSLSGLGSFFGIYGMDAELRLFSLPCGAFIGDWADTDLTAITDLCKMRTGNDGPALKERLERPFQKLEENSESRPGPI